MSLFLDNQVGIITGKKLVIEAQEIFADGCGISWFGSKTDEIVTPVNNTVSYNSGYTLRLTKDSGIDTEPILYIAGANNLIDSSRRYDNGSLPLAFDLTINHLFRIEITDSGQITVLVDGTQIL